MRSLYTLHYDKTVIIERFETIAGKTAADNYLASNHFKIIDLISNEKELLQSLQNVDSNTFIIIDFLQAIYREQEVPPLYDSLLFQIKQLANEQSWRGLILSQDLEEKAFHSRYCNHVLHLELSDELLEATRELSLIKSTHYKCRESQLSFNRETFQFG